VKSSVRVSPQSAALIPARSDEALCLSIAADIGDQVLSKEYTERIAIGAAFAGLCAAVRGAELGLRTAVPFLTGRGHDA
jgi:hypothetical protein